MIFVSKDAKCYFDYNATSKNKSENLKYNLEQLGKILNYYCLSDDTRLSITTPLICYS